MTEEIELNAESAGLYKSLLDCLNSKTYNSLLKIGYWRDIKDLLDYWRDITDLQKTIRDDRIVYIDPKIYHNKVIKLKKYLSEEPKIKKIYSELKNKYLDYKISDSREMLERVTNNLNLHIEPIDKNDVKNLMKMVINKEFYYGFDYEILDNYEKHSEEMDKVMQPIRLGERLVRCDFSDIFDVYYIVPLPVYLGKKTIYEVDFRNLFDSTGASKIIDSLDTNYEYDLTYPIALYIGLEGFKKSKKFIRMVKEEIKNLEENPEDFNNELDLEVFSMKKLLEGIKTENKNIEDKYSWLKKIRKIPELAGIVADSYESFVDIEETDIEAERLMEHYKEDLETAKKTCVFKTPNNRVDRKIFLENAGSKICNERNITINILKENPYKYLFIRDSVARENIIDISDAVRNLYGHTVSVFDELLYDGLNEVK